MTTEPTNKQRAAEAKRALAVFVKRTGNTSVGQLDPEDLNDVISDLICDLLHLADQNALLPAYIMALAQANYETDLLEALP